MEQSKNKSEVVYNEPCHVCGYKYKFDNNIFFDGIVQNEIRKYNINGIFGEINICDRCVDKIKSQTN